MSAIPPSVVSSVLQTPLAQGQVAPLRDSEESQKLSAERRQALAISEHDSTVETTDNDTQVHTDAEGSGSQGRSFSEEDAAEDQAGAADQASADQTTPADDQGHIDLEA